MSESIEDVLKRKKFSEPPEIQIIKEFVLDLTKIVPKVSVTTEAFIIRMPNAAAAGVLRFQLANLQELLETNRRLIIRIGN